MRALRTEWFSRRSRPDALLREQPVRAVDPQAEPVRLGGVGVAVAKETPRCTGIEARTTVLGYTQLLGTPVAADRVLATQFGYRALELLMEGGAGRM